MTAVSSLPPRFGKYTILGHLATGGMAEVYLARAEGIEGFEKIVVIKRIRPDLIGDRSTTKMFLHEARLAATLEHPNIAHVHEIDTVQGSYFFVMEYVHGADLRQLMEAAHRKGRTIPLAEAVNIIAHVCAALHYAHEKRDNDDKPLGIIHRDVSPSNVLISHDGAVKVCDFGVAKVSNRQSETQRGVVKGKFSYMAPEQCTAGPLDRRTDIFVIGVLLYEVTTLTRLFEANADFELMRRIVQDPIVPPSARVGIGAEYPPELERIVMKALSHQPGDRYPTAQAMQLDLEAFARERKMATSSVGLARLMGELFEKRVRAWQKADREGIPLGEHLLERAGLPDSDESYVPLIPTDPSVEVETIPGHTPHTPTDSLRRGDRPTGRRAVGWLLGAVIACLVAGGALAGGWWTTQARERAAGDALSGDADKIAGSIDAEVRAAHLRAEALASTPMLRAAIETDAATLEDMARSEKMFTPAAREVVEIFQQKDRQLISILRVPPSGRPLRPVEQGQTRLERIDGQLAVAVGAPIAAYGASTVVGQLVLSAVVDLAPSRRALEQHAARASIAGLGDPIAVIGSAGGADRVPIPLPAGADPAVLALVASPRLAPAPGWISAVELAGGAAAIVMVGLFALRVRRRR